MIDEYSRTITLDQLVTHIQAERVVEIEQNFENVHVTLQEGRREIYQDFDGTLMRDLSGAGVNMTQFAEIPYSFDNPVEPDDNDVYLLVVVIILAIPGYVLLLVGFWLLWTFLAYFQGRKIKVSIDDNSVTLEENGEIIRIATPDDIERFIKIPDKQREARLELRRNFYILTVLWTIGGLSFFTVVLAIAAPVINNTRL